MNTFKRGNPRRWVRLMIIILTIGLMSYSFIEAFKNYEENTKREQARYNLEHIVQCMTAGDRLFDKVNSHGLTFEDSGLWRICTNNVRTSTTGDVYVLDKEDYRFVYDNSNDIPKEPLFFTAKSVGKLFTDWKSGLAARTIMTAGTDSTASSGVTYNFDGSPEWLEWKTWEHDGHHYVIVQGTQADEVYAGLAGLSYLYYGFMLTLVMVLLIEITTIPLEEGYKGANGD